MAHRIEIIEVNGGSTPDDSDKVTSDERHPVLEFTDESWWARKTPH